MGVLTGLVLLPLAPLRATIWVAEKLAAYAESELTDERALRRLLVEAEEQLESGELTEAEFEQIEDELLDRIDALRSVEAGGMGR
jgi:ribosome assembly protein YihI (activator of Der GTPase)